MKPIRFKTLENAYSAYLKYVAETFPNTFQDARSIARVHIREFGGVLLNAKKTAKYWCIQFGDYGPYLSS